MKGLAVIGQVKAPVTNVFAVLGDIQTHHVLAGRRMNLVEASSDGEGRMLGVIDLDCPLGVRRRIAMREIGRETPSLIWGVAAASSGSVALVSWSLTDIADQQTRVSLAISPVSVGVIDHVLLRLGGRRLLSALLSDTLQRLEALVPVVESAGMNWSLEAANSYESSAG